MASWSRRALPFVIAILACIPFTPALHGGFVDWDDEANFVTNPAYRGLGWMQLQWMFTTVHMGHYIPVTWITLGLDFTLWGMDPRGYHLTNVLLHAANSGLFYLLSLRLLRATWPRLAEGDAPGLYLAAAFAALLFGVHPLRVESVAWVTERRDVLCGFFFLSALLAYLRARDVRAGEPATRRVCYCTSVALFACALLSKSMAVSLPVVLVILDLYPWRRRPEWKEKIPFFLLSLAGSIIALYALITSGNLAPVAKVSWLARPDLTWWERAIVSLKAIAFYLWKTVVPVNLAPLYELPFHVTATDPSYLIGGLVVLGLTGLAMALRTRMPAVTAVWAAFIVMLLPTFGLFGIALAADRYTYLPCLGWALLVAGSTLVGPREAGRRSAFARYAVALAPVPIILVLAGLTWHQTRTWRTSETLWTHALEVNPSSRAHLATARVRTEQGRLVDAVYHDRKAIELRPDYDTAYNNLGNALARIGMLDEAVQRYQQAIELRPSYAEAYYNLGSALLDAGRPAEARPYFSRAVQLNPGLTQAQRGLELALQRLGRSADTDAGWTR